MINVISCEFKKNGKSYYFNANDLELHNHEAVIVETERGLQYANTITDIKKVDEKSNGYELQNVIRKANKDDEIKYLENIDDANKALKKAESISKRLGLQMKFTEATYTFDRNQLLFYYISDNRVDFRELARELAGIYKTRIELRQIGVRDKAKEISGLGPCGRELCCSSFLQDLDSVSISMAKNQSLALNPNKINGLCGRLLCCLNYEDALYKENREGMPELGQMVKTENGEGYVFLIDIPNRRYLVNIPNYGKVEIKLNKCDKNAK